MLLSKEYSQCFLVIINIVLAQSKKTSGRNLYLLALNANHVTPIPGNKRIERYNFVKFWMASCDIER